jgi:hypothetical protein
MYGVESRGNEIKKFGSKFGYGLRKVRVETLLYNSKLENVKVVPAGCRHTVSEVDCIIVGGTADTQN